MQGPLRDPPGRPSVEAMIRHYWDPSGGRYREALSEARQLLDAGATEEEAAEWIGWTVPELRAAGLPSTSASPAKCDEAEITEWAA